MRTPIGRLALGLAVLALACTGTVGVATGADAATGRYLALGDSVPFGFSPRVTVPSPAGRYVGYPELIGASTGLRVTNLSCPGQASGGMNSFAGADNGCFGFRRRASLHTTYGGTQLAAAVTFLKAHPRTRAVTVMLGGNDLFLCREQPHGCDLTEFEAAMAAYQKNLAVTYAALRAAYRGRIIAVGYYSTDYTDTLTTTAVQVANFWAAWVGGPYGVTVADGFTAFQSAAAADGGDPCAAGLLIPLVSGGCDVHPSRKGALLLAKTVTAEINA